MRPHLILKWLPKKCHFIAFKLDLKTLQLCVRSLIITKIFVRTFTNVPNLPIIIPSSYHAKIFVRTFTNIPKLPIVIPDHHP
jgi:hypothetical protein